MASNGNFKFQLVAALLLLLPAAYARARGELSFRDETALAGISEQRAAKFGGPCVADLDGDGIYDLILTFHANFPLQLYFGNTDGSFSLSNYTVGGDIHGVSAGFRTAASRGKMFTVSVGGGKGRNLKLPIVLEVDNAKQVQPITTDFGLGKVVGRGRQGVFMDLSMTSSAARSANGGGPDLIFMNALGLPKANLSQFAYKNVKGQYELRRIPGIAKQRRGRTEVTDIDGDGIMEVISIQEFRMYKLIRPFEFVDVTETFIPPTARVSRPSVTAVAEFDMDNDGDFDLYVATTDQALVTNLKPNPRQPDRLLKNSGGRYIDVTEAAGIPSGTNSIGVSTGDFNNDGFVDIIVVLWEEPDMILLNQGDGTFKRIDRVIPKSQGVVGNNAVAVDYNEDGLVDMFVGHGDQTKDRPGRYYLMRNTMPISDSTNYLHVRVGSAPDSGATSLHAVVTVRHVSGLMVRRVGSPGAQAGGLSYLDTVHFGLGSFQSVTSVTVQWTNGVTRTLTNVRANEKVSIGLFPE